MTHVVELTLVDPDATIALGRRIGGLLQPGDLVILSGELGAGKTTLTRGIGQGLDVRGAVTSPTFVIARRHPSASGGPALVHVDAYRLGSAAEIDDLDLDLDGTVTVVEWGSGRVEHLASDRLEIDLVIGTTDDSRVIGLRGIGERWQGVDLASLARA